MLAMRAASNSHLSTSTMALPGMSLNCGVNSHHLTKTRNIVEEENAAYGTGRPERDVGANMESHGKTLKDRVDDASDRVQRGPKKADPTDDGRFQVGDEGASDAHDLASSRQP